MQDLFPIFHIYELRLTDIVTEAIKKEKVKKKFNTFQKKKQLTLFMTEK